MGSCSAFLPLRQAPPTCTHQGQLGSLTWSQPQYPQNHQSGIQKELSNVNFYYSHLIRHERQLITIA